MLDEFACGVYVISVTPFDERGVLDLDGTDRLVDFYLNAGADGLTILVANSALSCCTDGAQPAGDCGHTCFLSCC
jgi:dihydrodipicolinate synthase/N-acetylneuraminate lyase